MQTYDSLLLNRANQPDSPAHFEQLGMFDKLGMTDQNLFAWEADLVSGTVTKTDLYNNASQQIPYSEFLKKLPQAEAQKIKRAVDSVTGQKSRAIAFDLMIDTAGALTHYKIKGMAHHNGSGIYAAGLAYDTDKASAQAARLEYLEKHDPLTGLCNAQTLETLFEDISRFGMYPQTVIIAHIDRFKEINDSLGYHAGNTLIKNVSDALNECFLDAEVLARIGGGEYCAIYAGTSCFEIDNKIKQANMMLHSMYLNLIKTEVSFGYAVATEDSDFSVLYKQAVQKIIRSRNARKTLSERSVIDCINHIIETRVGWGKRQTRLQSLSAQIANCMGCTEECVESIKVLAKIADIGLIGIDEGLLKNRAVLKPEEQAAYQNHIETGRAIISSIGEVAEFETLYLDIFKRYDEWQDAIALQSRILAAVTGFDDIVSSGISVGFSDIKERFLEKSGKEYCPAVVMAILAVAGKHYA